MQSRGSPFLRTGIILAVSGCCRKVSDKKIRLIRSQSGLERTSLLFLRILEGILIGPVTFLSWSSFIADSTSFTVVS